MRRAALLLGALLGLAACTSADRPQQTARATATPATLPPMKVFDSHRTSDPTRANSAIARDFMDLTFQLESGRALPVLTRFEEPVTIRTTGAPPAGLSADLDRLIARLRDEAGLTISRVGSSQPASITIESLTRAQLQRAVPQAACFVVPRVSNWEEFRRYRHTDRTDWTQLRERRKMAIFLPRDVSPQEVRDCLHEEIAQALGPLNDLYRLTDSVFNDDNFHTVLTGFDMLILQATYAPELHSGMTRAQVAARLPAILARLNPEGANRRAEPRGRTSREWIEQIETALGPRASMARRRSAARRAVAIARASGWHDNRLAFSLFALGRLSLARDPELALTSFLKAGEIYAANPETAVHEAHIAMQLAAFALSAGRAKDALEIVDRNTDAVAQAENAALLASLLLVKAEALELLGRADEAARLRRESLGWARYGFGDAEEVRRRAGEIAAISPRNREAPS